jgi:hypothetical protein
MTSHEIAREALEVREVISSLAEIAGILLGVAIALALSGLRLRWTWALGGLPATGALALVDPQLAIGCGAATGAALVFAIAFRIAAHLEGGAAARRAREAIGPLQLLWAVAPWRRAPDPFLLPSHRRDSRQRT